MKRKRLFQYPAPPRHGSCWTTWKTGDGHREEVSPQQGRREPETSHGACGSGGAFASWKKTSPSSTNLWRVPCAMSKLWRGEAVPPKNSLPVHGSKRGRGLRTISLNHNEGDPEIHPRKARRIKGNFTENCQRSLRTELTDTHRPVPWRRKLPEPGPTCQEMNAASASGHGGLTGTRSWCHKQLVTAPKKGPCHRRLGNWTSV